MVIAFGSGRKRAGVEQGASPHLGQLCRAADSVIWRRLNCLGHAPAILPRWLKSGRRYPLTDVQGGLELPSLAAQEFALLTLRQSFGSLFDAVRFLRQALLERGFGLVELDAQHGWLS